MNNVESVFKSPNVSCPSYSLLLQGEAGMKPHPLHLCRYAACCMTVAVVTACSMKSQGHHRFPVETSVTIGQVRGALCEYSATM